MKLSESCVMCHSSIQHLTDYEGVPLEQLLVEVSLADLAASQLVANKPKSNYIKKEEMP